MGPAINWWQLWVMSMLVWVLTTCNTNDFKNDYIDASLLYFYFPIYAHRTAIDLLFR